LYYPRYPQHLMPTRLGNVLRRYEIDAGSEYGLSVLTFAGHLATVASPEEMRHVNDQRIALDFAVQCCITGLLGSAVAVVFLWWHGGLCKTSEMGSAIMSLTCEDANSWSCFQGVLHKPHGIWLLVALAPYFFRYFAYRGSIVVAHEYGRALGALVDLNRFELYQRLRLVLPKTTYEERRLTKILDLLTEQHEKDENLLYVHPVPSSETSAPDKNSARTSK
jgi:hypothetical protein